MSVSIPFALSYYNQNRIEREETRTVSGKHIRKLKSAGFQPMFDIMTYKDSVKDYKMPSTSHVKKYPMMNEDIAWLLLLDVYLFDSPLVNSWAENWPDHVGRAALQLIKQHNLDSTVFDKLIAHKIKTRSFFEW